MINIHFQLLKIIVKNIELCRKKKLEKKEKSEEKLKKKCGKKDSNSGLAMEIFMVELGLIKVETIMVVITREIIKEITKIKRSEERRVGKECGCGWVLVQ